MTNAVAVNRDIRCCRRVQPTCGLTPPRHRTLTLGALGNTTLASWHSSSAVRGAQLGTPSSRYKWLGLRLNYLRSCCPHRMKTIFTLTSLFVNFLWLRWIIRLPITRPDLSVESVIIIITFLPASLLWRFINEVGFLGFFRLFRLSCASTNVLEKVTPKSTLSEQPDHWKVNKHMNECCPD